MALTATVAAVAPTIASGAENAEIRPMPESAQRATMDWDLPLVPGLRHLHAKQRAAKHRQEVARRHARQAASPIHHRATLTGSPQTVAHAMVLRRGWDESQWSCLYTLWTRESDWNPYAENSSSGAYGIPQALPGYKMASAGSDWRTNPITQITWGFVLHREHLWHPVRGAVALLVVRLLLIRTPSGPFPS